MRITRCSEVDGQGLKVYKVVCWYRFRETSAFKLHIPLGRKLAPTEDWVLIKPEALINSDSVNLGIPEARGRYTGTIYLLPVRPLRSSRC